MIDFFYGDFLNYTIDFEEPTNSQGLNVPGYVKDGWTAVHTSLPASIQPISGDKREYFKKLNIDVDFEIITDNVFAKQIINGWRVNDGTNKYVVRWYENQGGVDLVFAIYAKHIIDE